MFRLTHYLRLANGTKSPVKRRSGMIGKGPIVIWNLTRTCNLECVHCYASSKNYDYTMELGTEQAFKVLDDLKEAGCFSLILSGGEPLFRPDLFEIAKRAKSLGFFLTLSTNGTMIGEEEADRIQSAGFDYVGVSLDGIGDTHDRFRGVKGSFDKAVEGIKRCSERGMRTGVRFTLTKMNAGNLPGMFDFIEEHGIGKLYLSHLVYSGRGGSSVIEDLSPEETRKVMEFVLEKANEYVITGRPVEIVTGNNEADAVFLLLNLLEGNPGAFHRLLPVLEKWGGNGAGRGIVNIDTRGGLHPDPLMYDVKLGSVLEKEFGEIWSASDNEILRRLRERPRKIKGRCGKCAWLGVCGGASRTRAQRITGDMWESDPACYISDCEIDKGFIHEMQSVALKPATVSYR